MLKKAVSFLIVLSMLSGSFIGLSANAVETQNNGIQPFGSLYLSVYTVKLTAKGSGVMSITYTIGGTRIMDKIGAYSLKVEQLIGSKWYHYTTYYGSEYPELYAYNTTDKIGTFQFAGAPGTYYRVTLTSYAELKGGYDYGEPLTSSEIQCK